MREKRLRLSEEEHEQLSEVRDAMYPNAEDDVPFGVVISKLCERFEKQQQYL